MVEGEKWRPRSGPSPLEQARADYRDPVTGEMRFRNLSNMFWGYVSAWGTFAQATLCLNRSILTNPDPMTGHEVVAYGSGTFIVSVAALCVLARPSVKLLSGRLTVRNPLRAYSFDLAAVESLESGLMGFPKLIVAGRTVRVVGMEETTLQLMRGGSDDMAVLQAEIGDSSFGELSTGVEPVRSSWAPLDRGLALLLTAWLLYVVSFFVPLNG